MSLEEMTKIDNLKSWTSGVEVEWEAVQQLRNIAASVRGLGLRRRHQSVVVADTAENRGMIYAAKHLLKVEQN